MNETSGIARITVRVTNENYEFLKMYSRLKCQNITSLINHLVEEERAKSADLVEQFRGLIPLDPEETPPKKENTLPFLENMIQTLELLKSTTEQALDATKKKEEMT